MHARIGELLGRIVELSDHDVAEILEHQSSTRSPFGHIAMQWGLCQPQHVWRAWAQQCAESRTPVDLSLWGVDTTAVGLLPREVASRLGMIPIRSFDDEIIVATAGPSDDCRDEVSREVGKRCRFVLADPAQIREAIAAHYYAA